jgi:hypothetical protein
LPNKNLISPIVGTVCPYDIDARSILIAQHTRKHTCSTGKLASHQAIHELFDHIVSEIPEEEEEKRRRSEGTKVGRDFFVKLVLDPEVTHSKEGIIEGCYRMISVRWRGRSEMSSSLGTLRDG